MFHAIEERQTVDDPQRRQPTLDEMTLAALDLLDERPEGFFLMVEAGQIDWAGHANDAGWLLHEMLRLDVTLDTIFNWMNDRDDTLVIVTADHETGGFGFSYSSNDLPDATPLSGPVFDHRDHQPNFNFGALHQLDELASQQKTFGDLLDHLDEGDPDAPAKLQTLVDKHTSYTISSSQAERVLQKHKNPFHAPNNPYLTQREVPQIDDFSAFYPYAESTRSNLLGRTLADQQNVVWSTGSHTHTPVPVVAAGPPAYLSPFEGWMHLVDVGRALNELIDSH